MDKYRNVVHEFTYTGDDVVEVFIRDVLKCEDKLLSLTKMKKYMVISKEEQEEFDLAEVCYICKNNTGMSRREYKLFTPGDWKVRDHCDITGINSRPVHTCKMHHIL